MTKRPLLFGVMAFVFGELAGLNRYMAMGLGMVTLLLLLWSIWNRRRGVETMPVFVPVLCGCILLGILNGYRCRLPDRFREEIQEALQEGTVSCVAEGRVKRIENRDDQQVLQIQTDYIAFGNYNSKGKTTERNSDFSARTYIIQIYVTEQEEDSQPVIGSRIRCEFDIRVPAEPTNPGEFNGKHYYQARGIDFLGYTRRITVVADRRAGVLQWMLRLQDRARQMFYKEMAGKNAGLMSAMLLGTGWELDSEIRRLFQRNGIAHILAISALHISIIGGVGYRFLRRAGCSYASAGIPVMLILLLYGWMTGFGASTIRAVLMFLLMLWADILGRTYDMLTAMAIACLLMLLENPDRLWDAGFLLSFSAVFALGAVVPIVQNAVDGRQEPAGTRRERGKTLLKIRRYLIRSFLSGLVLQAVTAPVVAYFYYNFPIYGVLLNLIVVPLMTPVVICGCCSVLLYPFLPWLGTALLLPCEWILNFFQALCRGAEALPGAVWHIGAVSLWEIGIYYGMLALILLFFCCGKQIRAVLLCIILFLCILFRGGQELRIVMLDVGQGDSILMKTPGGYAMLFDGGSSSRSSIGEYVLTPALNYYGCSSLDYIFVSHMDQDHINGITECIALSQDGGIPVRHLVVPALAETEAEYRSLLEQAEQAGIPILFLQPGDYLLIDRLRVTCLYPDVPSDAPETGNISLTRNDRSMVLSVSYLEFHMLFTGDLEQKGEAVLIQEHEEWLQEKYTILKTGHHGSSGSSSMEFLERIQPDLALISCGRQNPYGHPHTETLERLRHAGCRIFGTPEKGAIEIRTDGKWMKVHFFNAQEEGL